MKDVSLPLRVAYFNKLIAIGLKVYEEGAVPDDATTPYVVITGQLANEQSNKTDFGHKAYVLLDIVTSTLKNSAGGSKGADLIASQILAVINSKTKLVINDDLQAVKIKLVEDNKLNSLSDTESIYRRLLRFEHIIRQLN